RRAGISPRQTWLWDDLPENLRYELQKRVHLLKNEQNVICFYKSPEYVLILTTQRLIVVDHNVVHSYFYYTIIEVRLNEIISDKKTKTDNDIINLILESREQITIFVEKGTWHILYNIIRLLSSEANPFNHY